MISMGKRDLFEKRSKHYLLKEKFFLSKQNNEVDIVWMKEHFGKPWINLTGDMKVMMKK